MHLAIAGNKNISGSSRVYYFSGTIEVNLILVINLSLIIQITFLLLIRADCWVNIRLLSDLDLPMEKINYPSSSIYIPVNGPNAKQTNTNVTEQLQQRSANFNWAHDFLWINFASWNGSKESTSLKRIQTKSRNKKRHRAVISLPRPFFIVHFSIYFIDCLGTDTHYSNKSHLSNTFCVFAITVVYGFDAAKWLRAALGTNIYFARLRLLSCGKN